MKTKNMRNALMSEELFTAWLVYVKKAQKLKKYTCYNILSRNARYNLIYGERSNGKTYSVLELMVLAKAKFGIQGGIIRRWDMDFVGKRGSSMFANIVNNGMVEEVTDGKFHMIVYRSGAWYFAYRDEKLDKVILDSEPIAYAFSLNGQEHDKSTGYPNVKLILFDEFITRTGYLKDEFILFMNTISTIIRDRNDALIFMCANTVNKYCIYFEEMGLYRAKYMKVGEIQTAQFGENNELRVALEHTEPNVEGKASDLYFAFDNPKLKMITKGEWELDIYPHCPIDSIRSGKINIVYFIEFGNELLQCEVVTKGSNVFTYVHRKTTPLKYPDKEIIYSTKYDSRYNWNRRITQPNSNIGRFLLGFYKHDKVYYSSNEVGDVVRNYFKWCGVDLK